MAKAPETSRDPRAALATGAGADDGADDALLQRIAARDRQAFQEFYRRHEAAAFALAWHIVRDRELASEAVQDALLRMWTSAAQYEPGNARSWLLRIVAREAIRCCRQRNRRRREVVAEEDVPYEAATQAAGPGETAERDELLGALRAHLGRLSPVHRQVLALYYGGGLSQREIAEALETTQQTVSNKLEDALQHLRKGLAEAGAAAALPMLDSGGLTDALRGGAEAPAELGATIFRQLGHAVEASTRAAAVKGSFAWLWWLGAALLAGGVVAAWQMNAVPPAEAQAPPATAASQGVSPSDAPAKPQQAPDEGAPLSASWDFAQSPAGPEFRVYTGDWYWAFDEWVNRKVMAVRENALMTTVLLPVRLPQRPCVVRMDITPQAIVNGLIELRWTDGKGLVPHTQYLLAPKKTVRITELLQHDYYLFDRYLLQAWKGELQLLSLHEAPYPGDRLSFILQNMVVGRLEIREMPIAEFPPSVRKVAEDPEAFLQSLKNQRPIRRFDFGETYRAPGTQLETIKRIYEQPEP